ncbi:MAG TPA: hypothetical protein VNQ77_00715 [Frankiaceae bacterium]|jgi:hypothetical protein|nr:hypothetical protein [Frankiaceae bacterium]
MKRTLTLRRETLSELTSGELGAVVGGTHAGCAVTDGCTHGPSLDARCPTTPLLPCLTLDTSPCIQTR